MKRILITFLTLMLLTGCQTNPTTSTTTSIQQETLIAPEDDTELYLAAREVSTQMAKYDEATMDALQDILISIDLNHTVNENLALIEDEDSTIQDSIQQLREAYNAVGIKDDTNVYDIYEGKELPVMGNVTDNESSEQACLTDTTDYRPVINTYMLDDPSNASATLFCVPSVRGAHGETRDYAKIFNALGYNVITIEPRFNHVEEDNRTYYLMNLDIIRGIRYVKYHADDLGVDSDKLIVIGGSKGNYAHMMTTLYYDLTPEEYAKEIHVDFNNYESDEIDEIDANVAVQVWNYGNMFAVDDNGELTLDDRGLYSQENYDKGLQLPAMLFLGGNDDTMVTTLTPTIIHALIDFNADESKLYDIQWEVHQFTGVPHGSGAGLAYYNVVAYWNEADAFFKTVLNIK